MEGEKCRECERLGKLCRKHYCLQRRDALDPFRFCEDGCGERRRISSLKLRADGKLVCVKCHGTDARARASGLRVRATIHPAHGNP